MCRRSSAIAYRRPTPEAFDDLDRTELARRYGRAAAYQEEASESATFWLKLCGLLLVLSLSVLLAAYTLSQVTSRDSARRILSRAIPEITDFDHAFAAHYDELQSAASSPSGAAGVKLVSYPVQVTLKPVDVINRSPAEVRQTLLQRTSDTVYESGINAFSRDGRPVKLGSSGVFSGPWAFSKALSVLNPGTHRKLVSVTKIALAVAAVLGLIIVLLGREYNRIVVFAMALLFAAVPGLVVGGIVWLGVQVVFGTSSDPLIGGTSDIMRDVAWYVVLSYLIYIALSIGLVILGFLIERVSDMVATGRDPAHGREYRRT